MIFYPIKSINFIISRLNNYKENFSSFNKCDFTLVVLYCYLLDLSTQLISIKNQLNYGISIWVSVFILYALSNQSIDKKGNYIKRFKQLYKKSIFFDYSNFITPYGLEILYLNN